MFDNLREDATSNPYTKKKQNFNLPQAQNQPYGAPSSRRILGMTAVQRFVITFMFFLAVCIIGAMALLVTGKIGF